jgi:hypothetical protein
LVFFVVRRYISVLSQTASMELSFWIRFLLQLAVIGLSVLAIFYPYLAIPAAIIASVLLINEISSRGAERDDFKKKIIPEALAIVDHIISSTSSSPIVYPVWSSKPEGFKASILGDKDYALWKQFYDRIEELNQYLFPKRFIDWGEFQKFNRAIFDSFFKIHDEISWVREAIPEEHVSSILSRASLL